MCRRSCHPDADVGGRRHKTDAHDARSTAVAGRSGTGVKPLTVDDPQLEILDVVLERRWQLVAARQATLCRLHDHLACLLPGGTNKHLTADKAAALLRGSAHRPRRDPPPAHRPRTRRRTARGGPQDRTAGRRHRLDAQRARQPPDRHRRDRPHRRLNHPGHHRRPDPVPIRRGVRVVRRDRADRGGVGRHHPPPARPRRQPAAEQGDPHRRETQIRLDGPGRDYCQRRRTEGKTNAEAVRALKRHITTAVYRTLQADAAARAARRVLASDEDKRS